ncbi:6668_t:CDS:2, partial [Funneliformis mosseae]
MITYVSSFPTTLESGPPGLLNHLNKRENVNGPLISKKSEFTFFWVESESDFKSTKTVDIKSCNGKKLATVNKDFADAMKLEGTGITKDDRVFNLDDCDCGSSYSCFFQLDKTKFPFGISSSGVPLVPFVTVAANDIKKGTLIYIPKLDGIVLPNGKTHNGCLRVDDEGFSFGKKHIDWFVAKKSNFNALIKKNSFSSVEVFSGTSPS